MDYGAQRRDSSVKTLNSAATLNSFPLQTKKIYGRKENLKPTTNLLAEPFNAARNCRSKLAAFLRFFAKKMTAYGGQICWPC